MSFSVKNLSIEDKPVALLKEIPEPPKQLYFRGRLPAPELSLLTVVGSRRYTSYGKAAVEHLVSGLTGYPVGIVSGLALGIDSLAHEAALKAGLYTLAVPGSGINDEVIYPREHLSLARRILEADGGLLSEFAPDFRATKWSFVQRNRIMAGLSPATLVIEAAEKSGTLVTARLVSDYNRELLVVPGSIFGANSAGPHQFLKLGATPVTSPEDILLALGLESDTAITKKPSVQEDSLSSLETTILKALIDPLDRDSLIRACRLPVAEANVLIMEMEIKGLIKDDGGTFRSLL